MNNRYFISYFPDDKGYISEVKCAIIDSDLNMEECIMSYMRDNNIVLNCIKLN